MLRSREFPRSRAQSGRRVRFASSLNSQVLVLNRLWQAVNICSARRAFTLVYAGHAHVVSSDETDNFLTHDFESWRDFSANAPDHELVTTISFRIRVPRVIVLLVLRSAAEEGSEIHAAQCVRARQEHLPILRPNVRSQRPQPRSRHPARPRRHDHVGKHCLLLHRVQYAQRATGSPREAHMTPDPQTEAPEVAAVRADHLPGAAARKLETLCRSGILERRIERLSVASLIRP